MINRFKEGDEVVFQIRGTNVSRKGKIIRDVYSFKHWRRDEEPTEENTLAFYGENHFFAWLDVNEENITRV